MNLTDIVNVVSAELLKIRRRRAIWGLGSLWVTMGMLFGYLIPYLIRRYGENSKEFGMPLNGMLPSSFVDNVIQGFPLFGLAVSVAVGALIVGSEYGWNTASGMLIQGPGRLNVLFGKMLATAITLLTMVTIMFVVTAVCAVGIAIAESAEITWPLTSQIVTAAGAGWLILSLGASLGMLLATLFRGATMAVGLGLFYVLVFEGVFSGFTEQSVLIHDIAAALPGPKAGSLAASFVRDIGEGAAPGIIELVDPTHAAAVTALYVVGFFSLMALLFIRRDVTGNA